jgi:hypothetical protein
MATPVRFPLPASVFPAIKVASDQSMQFAATSERLLASTLLARHEFVTRYNRQLDPNSWQQVKRRSTPSADLAVFRPKRGIAIPAASANASPILIGTGSIAGSLDEVMLGLTASTTTAMRFVTSTMYKGVADARVLSRIDTPSDSDPFAFLGLKWLAKVPSKRLVPLARARDFVYLESTGVRDTDDGRGGTYRVGFQLMHSVDLSICPAMPLDFGVVRGHISFCLLFVESGENQVDVFCKGFVDPRGGLSRRLTIKVAADVIMDCGNAVKCAQRKKIEWTLQKEIDAEPSPSSKNCNSPDACDAILTASPDRYRDGDAGLMEETDENDASPLLADAGCSHCRLGRRRRSTVTAWAQQSFCGICSDRVCGRCSRQVTLPGSKTASETTTCCMACIERAETIDAASFARELAQRAMAFQLPAYRFPNTGALGSPSGEKLRLAPIQKKPMRQ